MPISFKVRVNEPTGSEVQVIGTFDGEGILAVLKGRSAPGPGETAELVFDPAKIHLFHKDSGKRVN